MLEFHLPFDPRRNEHLSMAWCVHSILRQRFAFAARLASELLPRALTPYDQLALDLQRPALEARSDLASGLRPGSDTWWMAIVEQLRHEAIHERICRQRLADLPAGQDWQDPHYLLQGVPEWEQRLMICPPIGLGYRRELRCRERVCPHCLAIVGSRLLIQAKNLLRQYPRDTGVFLVRIVHQVLHVRPSGQGDGGLAQHLREMRREEEAAIKRLGDAARHALVLRGVSGVRKYREVAGAPEYLGFQLTLDAHFLFPRRRVPPAVVRAGWRWQRRTARPRDIVKLLEPVLRVPEGLLTLEPDERAWLRDALKGQRRHSWRGHWRPKATLPQSTIGEASGGYQTCTAAAAILLAALGTDENQSVGVNITDVSLPVLCHQPSGESEAPFILVETTRDPKISLWDLAQSEAECRKLLASAWTELSRRMLHLYWQPRMPNRPVCPVFWSGGQAMVLYPSRLEPKKLTGDVSRWITRIDGELYSIAPLAGGRVLQTLLARWTPPWWPAGTRRPRYFLPEPMNQALYDVQSRRHFGGRAREATLHAEWRACLALYRGLLVPRHQGILELRQRASGQPHPSRAFSLLGISQRRLRPAALWLAALPQRQSLEQLLGWGRGIVGPLLEEMEQAIARNLRADVTAGVVIRVSPARSVQRGLSCVLHRQRALAGGDNAGSTSLVDAGVIAELSLLVDGKPVVYRLQRELDFYREVRRLYPHCVGSPERFQQSPWTKWQCPPGGPNCRSPEQRREQTDRRLASMFGS
jgi:hypothetical protein